MIPSTAPTQRKQGLARVLAELGLLLSEVGPEQKAVDTLRRSIDIRTGLLAENGDDTELRRELARSWADLGILTARPRPTDAGRSRIREVMHAARYGTRTTAT